MNYYLFTVKAWLRSKNKKYPLRKKIIFRVILVVLKIILETRWFVIKKENTIPKNRFYHPIDKINMKMCYFF